MSAHAPPLPVGLDPLIAEAKQRARRRRLLAVAVALSAAGATAGVVVASGAGGSSGAIPWLPTKPQIGPANPPLAAPCTASQLEASLSLQGATMSLAGPITLVNRSSQPCSLLGRPELSFAGATSKWKEMRLQGGPAIPFDPLAPPRGSLRAVRPGEHVSIQLWWSNWCGRGAKPGGSLTQPPSALVLTPPGGGQIRLTNASDGHGLPTPVCNPGPGGLSTLQAGNFTPFAPQQNFTLPLRARILPSTQLSIKGRRIPDPVVAARPGSWLSFTVVLTNRSRHAFHFGRTCPAYTEGVGADQNQAYILNCHGVDAIGPGKSVRFSMRVHVPSHNEFRAPPLGWTLAPHSIDAPQALAIVKLG